MSDIQNPAPVTLPKMMLYASVTLFLYGAAGAALLASAGALTGLILPYGAAAGALYGALVAAVVIGSLTAFLLHVMYHGTEPLPFLSGRGILMKYIVPVALRVAGRMGADREMTVRAAVELNNRIVLSRLRLGEQAKVMVLLPHCIQLANCDLRITNNIRNCTGCGRCEVKNLVQIADRFQLDMNVATGGTIARRLVRERRPDVIIAVACERDLFSGIQDSLPMAVLGVTNERPYGPCINTTVDSGAVARLVEAALNSVPKEEK